MNSSTTEDANFLHPPRPLQPARVTDHLQDALRRWQADWRRWRQERRQAAEDAILWRVAMRDPGVRNDLEIARRRSEGTASQA